MSGADERWHTFVIRLQRDSESDEWRGQIVHLPDQVSAQVASLEEVAAFIKQFAPSGQDSEFPQTGD